ncbi:hypothetical protein DPEC_G00256800 [Dallia pectoralis]|uniref:Uncharacterized protein n=1 Tax=Dallia pectoralis TaxID=75939 RepID=A0ACC2FR03_DALPE|nr:hypothetical protein DPEC_G00256800 [Dallia pectoralis]
MEMLRMRRTAVPQVMQWLSGQAHRHLLLSDREAFKITVQATHFAIVRACTQT